MLILLAREAAMRLRMLFTCLVAALSLGLAACGEQRQSNTSGPSAGSIYPTPTGGGY